MLTFKVASSFFFDRAIVARYLDKPKRHFYSKVGAVVRNRAQTSMRYRKRGTHSAPGQPPFAHKPNAYLRKWLYFSYDRATDSVVIGPTAGSKRGVVPRLHEFGGVSRSRGRTVTYPPRPYMEPALRAEEPKLPFYWAASAATTF